MLRWHYWLLAVDRLTLRGLAFAMVSMLICPSQEQAYHAIARGSHVTDRPSRCCLSDRGRGDAGRRDALGVLRRELGRPQGVMVLRSSEMEGIRGGQVLAL